MATKKTKSDRPKGHVILHRKVTFVKRTLLAGENGCLGMSDAIQLVESSIGGSPVGLDTKLSELFPSDSARQLFCQRVRDAANNAGCTRPFPCSPSTTIGQIASALSC